MSAVLKGLGLTKLLTIRVLPFTSSWSNVFATEKDTMPHDLRFCAWGCCHFVDNEPTTQSGYALAARAYTLGAGSSELVETIIPCRHASGRIQYAVECRLGFYLGLRLPRATGISVLEDKNPLVFDHATGGFLRVATDEDVRKWNVARGQALRIVKSVMDEIPSLLQVPFSQPKA